MISFASYLQVFLRAGKAQTLKIYNILLISAYMSNISHIFAVVKPIIKDMITSIEPSVNPTARYTINETCSILGIHRNTLRAYVNAGYIRTTAKVHGQRFKGTEILRFWKAFV